MGKQVGVALQVQQPALIAGNTIALAFPALAVTFQVSVFDLDARSVPRPQWTVSRTRPVHGFSLRFLWRLLDGHLVGRQGLAPEPVEPGTHLAKPHWIDVVDVAGALRLGANQMRLAQHLEMLGDSRLGDRYLPRDFSHRTRAGRDQLKDHTARRIAKGGKLGAISSHDL